MTADPRVSVIMAVHNEERFLAEAVDSVLAQDYTDFEVIVSDDGSTDGMLEIARTLGLRAPERIRVIRAERNQGKPFALNRALAVRRGQLISWLDGDDVMLPGKLARQVAVLTPTPTRPDAPTTRTCSTPTAGGRWAASPRSTTAPRCAAAESSCCLTRRTRCFRPRP